VEEPPASKKNRGFFMGWNFGGSKKQVKCLRCCRISGFVLVNCTMFRLALLLVLLLTGIAGQAQVMPQCMILDVSVRNAETNPSSQRSVEHVLQVTGISYHSDTALAGMHDFKVVFIPRILQSTFKPWERDSLAA
jgi:hypothetical protein